MTPFNTLTFLPTKSRLLILWIFMVFTTGVSAQLAIDVSVESANCGNDGSATLTVTSGNGPFKFSLEGENELYEHNSDTLFTLTWFGLYPGEYLITVIDLNDTIKENIIIQGNYSPPVMLLEVTKEESCEGFADGEITALVTDGLMDFQFELYAGIYSGNPVFITSNNSGVFNNLSAGIYTVILQDACFNQVVEDVLLSVYDPIEVTEAVIEKINCDSSLIRIVNPNFSAFRISAPLELETEFANMDSFFVPTDLLTAVELEVRDICLEVMNLPLNYEAPEMVITTSQEQCGTYTLSAEAINLGGQLAYELILPGGDTIFSDSAIVVTDAEYLMTYTAIARDTCGFEVMNVFSVNKFDTITDVVITPGICEIGSAQITVNLSSFALAPVTLSFLTTPEAYSGASTFVFQNSSDTYWLYDEITGDILAGNYTISVMDSCGTADTIAFEILESDLLNVNVDIVITPDCGEINSLTFNATQNGISGLPGSCKLYSIDGGGYLDSIVGQDSGTYELLSQGMYVLEYQLCSLSDQVVTDTLVIGPTPAPIISDLTRLTCDNADSLVVLVEGSSGVPEYEYRIGERIGTAFIVTIDWQSSPVLGPVIAGDNYTVQLRDKCGSITNRRVSSPQTFTPVILEDYIKCESDSIIFRVEDPLEGMNYIWNKNGNPIGFGESVQLFVDDVTGSLTLEVEIPGCTSDIYGFEWSGECFGSSPALPVEWLHFTANSKGSFVELNWATAVEINNDHFEVQRSVDGRNWESLGTLQGNGTSYVSNEYDFNDDKPFAGINYYRIKQVDYNGNYDYSDVRRVAFDGTGLVNVFPNPFNEVLYLKIDTERLIDVQNIRITDISGRSWKVNDISGSNDQLMINTAHLPKGSYFVQVIYQSNFLAPIMIVKY